MASKIATVHALGVYSDGDSGQIRASSIEITLNPSYCWDDTKIGLSSLFEIIGDLPVGVLGGPWAENATGAQNLIWLNEPYMVASKIQGPWVFFRSSYSKDHGILGSILGPRI